MPISVLCPACSAPVTAPDAAAGKRAKCPKCAALMILPGGAPEPAADDPPPKRKPRVEAEDDADDRPTTKSRRREEAEDEDDDERPAKKSSRRRDDDDDEPTRPAKKSSRRVVAAEDDEDDDRPTKKSRRRDADDDDDDRPRKKGKGNAKKKSGPPVPLLIGGGLVVLLLVAGGLYFAFSGGSSSGTGGGGGGGGAKGPNWVAFAAPDGSFAAAFPDGAPTEEDIESLSRQMGDKNAKPEEVKMAKDMMQAFGIKMNGWSRSHGDRKYLIMVMTVPPAMAKQMTPDAIMKQGQQQSKDKIISQTDFSSGGLQGKHVLSQDGQRGVWQLVRFSAAGPGKIVIQLVETKAELKADDADGKAFFDKMAWKPS